MRTPEGRIVGEHIGLAFYTIGQREGLGIGGMKDPPTPGAPWYVAGKDRERNELIVVQGHDHPLLLSRALTAADLAWVSGEAPAPDAPYGGKTRYRQTDAACRVADLDEAECRVEFDDPQWAVTPGPVGGALPGRGVPRRRRDPVKPAPAAALQLRNASIPIQSFTSSPTPGIRNVMPKSERLNELVKLPPHM